ncbi:MAG: glycosyltransferase family protein [Patescibacteria group bacterium]
MKDKVLCIIQARMGSSRLPGKVLLDLAGEPVLARIIERVKKSKLIDKIIIATSGKKDDDEIDRLGTKLGIDVFRGSENDVLDRYYQVAKHYGYGHIVRVTGDCPLIDPGIIDEVISLYRLEDVDYATNVIPPTYPDGLDAEIFSFAALEKAWREAKLNSGREHVTVYMWQNPGKFKQAHLNNSVDLSAKRWVLDNPEDYEVMKSVYEKLYANNPEFRMKDLLMWFGLHPEIEDLNKKIGRNEGLAKSLKEDKIIDN